ncbi:MAG TPA: hypothetical protein VKU42_13110 [Candidatus Angelobacter sp.]|nr:hypothetical protein [Candidatus Angelobacter sp.]
MKKLKYLLLAICAVVICGSEVFAQQAQQGQQQQQQPGQQQWQGGAQNWQNMDPQQIQQMMQQRMLDYFRQQMAVTNDDEWGVIQDRLTKVMKLKTQAMFSGGAGMMAGMRRNGGGNGQGFRGVQGMAQPDPSADSLRTALDNGAPNAQVKAALDKLRDSRKQKAEELSKAQEDLRSVLTVRQEATLVLGGMLD